MTGKGQTGIYIHWPFCLAKCPYCDFNSHISASIDQDLWRESYLKALDYYKPHLSGRQVVSIFFGGGTPSLMPPETVAAIINKIHALAIVANDVEITLEANPTSVEMDKFEAFRLAGVNRVSLGVQALNDADLKFLGRQHSAAEALAALEIAKKNFNRVSFDLIYARPQQTLKQWEEELRRAAQLVDEHLSLYQLTIERGTPFFLHQARGLFSVPDEEMAADFYDLTQDILEAEGLPAYEVSNHAREGGESRHNMIYWRYGDYVGIGPGAHGRLMIGGTKHATRDHRAPDVWLFRVAEHGCGAHPFEALRENECFVEALMMGLRLREGVERALVGDIDEGRLGALRKEGFLDFDRSRLVLTRAGRLRLNAILRYLLEEQVSAQQAATAS